MAVRGLLPVLALAVWIVAWTSGYAGAGVGLSAATARYTGSISAERNRRFFEMVEGRTVRRLVITSDGGEVAAGIALGSWVFEHRVDVEVPGYCLSSCANYVFPAGRRKFIGAGAVVAWHGNYHHLGQTGLWKDEVAERMERHGEDAATAGARVRGQVDRLVRMERDFFARIGVDEYLCWIGKLPPYRVPDYYFLSVEDMARFGVTRVQAPVGYEDMEFPGLAVDVRYIRLDRERGRRE